MSKGITPYDFVQQVFYAQEKVLLDFYPTDDVYKEVLMEANLALQELQQAEDWLWLRETRCIGFTGSTRFKTPRSKYNEVEKFSLPANVYKPSRLYGDCVRLCRYRLKPQFEKERSVYYEIWNSYIHDRSLPVSTCTVLCGQVDDCFKLDIDDYAFGGFLTFDICSLDIVEILEIIDPGCWYIGLDGSLVVGVNSIINRTHGLMPFTQSPVIQCSYKTILETNRREPIDEDKELRPYQKAPEPHCIHEAFRYLSPHVWHMDHYLVWDFQHTNYDSILDIDRQNVINVPYASSGEKYHRDIKQSNLWLMTEELDHALSAVVNGNEVTFTRPLIGFEKNRIALMDCQMQIDQFHICNEHCISRFAAQGISSEISYPDNPCYKVQLQTEQKMLGRIPDQNYMVLKTASYHAEGSPPAQGRLASLQDQASKILSGMRQNNAEKTRPDYIDYSPIAFIDAL
jgi:hypothetical protein